MHVSLADTSFGRLNRLANACKRSCERDTMLITHPAIHNAEESGPGVLHRIREHLLRFFGLHNEVPDAVLSAPPVSSQEAPTEPILRIVETDPDVLRPAQGFRWRRHPQLLKRPEAPVATDQRSARHEAVRGLYAARAGALDVAEAHFTRAAGCPDIDLSAIPGFWQLSRAAMLTAVGAYERAGRIRDAAALSARIRTMFRPRAVASLPANVRHLPEQSPRISSNS